MSPLMRDEADARAVQQAPLLPMTRPRNACSALLAWRCQLHVACRTPETGVSSRRQQPPARCSIRGVEGEIALRLGQDLTAEQAEALDYTSALALLIDAPMVRTATCRRSGNRRRHR